jgi:hypothetical protein
MASGDDALRVLQNISTQLDMVIKLLLERQGTTAVPPHARPPFQNARGAPGKRGPSAPIPHIAPDSDLDSDYGDPEVRAKSPRDWTGDSMQGKHFSECPAEYLELVANRLDYFASQNESEGDPESIKKARYNRLDASRARGWAERVRNGRGTPSRPAKPFDDTIPFSWVIGFIIPALGALHSALSVL